MGSQDRPSRLALVVHTFGIGGLERFVARLSNHIDRTRFTPHLVCLATSGEASQWLSKEDVSIVELSKRSGNDWRAVTRLTKLLRSLQIDIVQSHNWGTLLETVVARQLARVPVHVHAERGTVGSDIDLRGFRRVIRSWAMRSAFRHVDQILAVSRSVAERVQLAGGVAASKIRTIENGVDTPAVGQKDMMRYAARRSLGLHENDFLVGSVGRLVKVKGFECAIAAMARLSNAERRVHFAIIGDGPERTSLESFAATLGIRDVVHFVGHQDNVGKWLVAFDLYLNSSVSEGMSQSVLEAMAVGLPLVVTDVGANAQLAGGEVQCGQVVPPSDPATMAAAIQNLSLQPESLAKMAETAKRRHANEFSVDRMVKEYESLYRNLVVQHRERFPFCRQGQPA